MFSARCECFSGFQSSNPIGGSVLRTSTDRCELCIDINCGARETQSPTMEPTKSHTPTHSPSVSSRPTFDQRILEPSYSPSITTKPSANPSREPVGVESLFDGESCREDQECRVRICSLENVCGGMVSHIQTVLLSLGQTDFLTISISLVFTFSKYTFKR